ncbi:MAG: hypothetical protein WAU28_05725 [Candidatus Moraniibacteriota bacterium]
MKLSKMVRSVGTVVASVLLYAAIMFYNAVMPGIEAQVALGQVKDSISSYAFAQAFMGSHMGKPLMFGLYAITLVALWWHPLAALIKSAKNPSEDDQS